MNKARLRVDKSEEGPRVQGLDEHFIRRELPQGGSLNGTLVAGVLADDLRCWSGTEGGGKAEGVPMTESRDGTSSSLA